MAFHSQHLHFAIFDDDDGACCPLDGRTTKKLFNGITSAFQRSRKQSNGVQAVAILSDNVFLAREDAKTISNIIKDNGGSIQESCGPMVQVKSMEGHSIRIFLVGGINPLVAAMEELIVEDGKKPVTVVDLPAGDNIVDLTAGDNIVDLTAGDSVIDLTADNTEKAPRVGRAARAAKREVARKAAEAKKAASKAKATTKMQPIDVPPRITLKSAFKPETKKVVIKVEGVEDLGTPPPKTVYRKTPVPKEASKPQQAEKKKMNPKKKQAPDTPPLPPSPDTPVVVEDDESTKLDDATNDSESTASYQDFNGTGFTQEALVNAQQRAMGKLIDEFLAEKLPETPDSVKEYMHRSKKDQGRHWLPTSPDSP